MKRGMSVIPIIQHSGRQGDLVRFELPPHNMGARSRMFM